MVTETSPKLRVPPSSAIFVYSEGFAGDPFLKALPMLGGVTRHRRFDHLSDCVMETLDDPPAVVVFNVLSVTPILLMQLERIRAAEECTDVALVVRTQTLDEEGVLSLLASEVNHFTVGFGPYATALEEIEALLKHKNRRHALSRSVVSLAEKVKDRLPEFGMNDLSPALQAQLRQRYGFTTWHKPASHSDGAAAWGFLPVSEAEVAFYAVRATGQRAGQSLAARKHCTRMTGWLRSAGASAADPAEVHAELDRQMRAWVSIGQRLDLSYAVFNRQSGTLSVLSTEPAAVFLSPGDAAPFRPLEKNAAHIDWDSDGQAEATSLKVSGRFVLLMSLGGAFSHAGLNDGAIVPDPESTLMEASSIGAIPGPWALIRLSTGGHHA